MKYLCLQNSSSLKSLWLTWGLFCLALLGVLSAAQAQQRPLPAPWREDAAARRAATGPAAAQLRAYRALTLDVAALRGILAAAPLESATQRGVGPVLTLPLPDGTTTRFALVESPLMAPALAAQYPNIKTYAGTGLDDPTASLRCDLTPLGFHAQVLSRTGGAVYIEPVSATDLVHYLSYYKADVLQGPNVAPCGTTGMGSLPAPSSQRRNALGNLAAGRISAGTSLRVYNLAIGAPAEFTTTYGSISAAMSTITTVVNQVKGIMELELSVRLVLAGTKIYDTNEASTDIYTNPGSHSQNLIDNQAGLTPALLGISSFDVAQVFTTSTSGGLAALNSVCSSGSKARGSTGFSVGSLSIVATTIFAHELGHQFGATHTFNSAEATSCAPNRAGATAYEPGAGTTVMSYAAACSPDNSLQYGSSPNYHVASFEQIQNYIATTTCQTTLATGNTAPTITVPTSGKTLPIGTPFKLTATGADTDNDALTYSWEEYDLGPAALLTDPQVAGSNVPLFRVRPPVASPTRYFPQLSDVLAGNTNTSGERLPTVTRSLTFRCGVRDQHNGSQGVVGGINFSDDVSLSVTSAAGPFAVTVPNTAVSWTGNTTQTVTWDVNNTTAAPVSCANVNIRLSTDGGTTFPYLLAGGTANDGTEAVTLPNLGAASSTCRVLVEAADNYFFDIGNANFTLTPGPGASVTSLAPSSGPVGTSVTISGSGFGTTATVTVNGVAATTTSVANTSIVFTVPAAALTGQVIVTVGGVTTNAGSFSVTPVITGIAPGSSAAAGTSITISGTSFGGVTGVTFANGVTVPASAFTSSSLTAGATNSVTFVVPGTAASGNLYLTTAGGNSAGTPFTVLSFSVTSRSPARNGVLASGAGSVSLTFNQTPDANTAAGTYTGIFSSQYGGRRNGLGTFSTTGNTLTYAPSSATPFRPGEVVSVTTTSTAANTGGTTLPAETYQFRVAAGKATGTLGAAVSVTTGNRPQDVALGDVNGDGYLDAVAANNDNGIGTTLSVRLGDGAGNLSGTTNLTVGTSPRAVVLADVNNDGRLDVLVTCQGTGGNSAVYVLVRNATGSSAADFATPITLSMATNPFAGPGLAVADLNNDGWLDVVMPGGYSNTAILNIFLNAKTAAGTFNTGSVVSLTGDSGSALALPDLNNDGKADVLFVNSTAGTVAVALGNGAGGFTAQPSVTVGTSPVGLAVGDLNGDGNLDMAVANSSNGNVGNVSIRLGNGSGGFTSPATSEVVVGSATDQRPRQVALADLNGDGILDLLATNFFTIPGQLSVRLGAGNGSFTAPATPEYNTFSQCYGLAVADLNGDAALDVVTANFGASAGTGGLSVLLGVPVPVVTSINPTSGPTGTSVTITGSGFVASSTATIGGVALGSPVVNTTTQTITGTVGAATPVGTQAVAVTSGSQTSTGNPNVTFTVTTPGPTLTSVSPAAELPGQTVTLTGTNFTSGSTVSFGGVAAASVTYVSATTLTAVVPVGAGATVSVGTTAGASNTSPFTLLAVADATTLSVNTCTPATAATNPADSNWHYVLVGGQVVLAYNTQGLNLGTVSAELLRADPAAAVRQNTDGRYYLGRNWHLTTSAGAFTGSTVKVRFYGLTSEYNQLQAADPGNVSSLSSLRLTQYNGGNEDCQLGNNGTTGQYRLLTPTSTSGPSGSNFFVSEANVTDHFSEFYVSGGNTPLPVQLVSFTATAQGAATVRLAWTTASELNSARFEVERSLDGVAFGKVGEVAAAGSSPTTHTYGLTDAALPAGAATLYYRLRQVDLDGTFSYSPVRVVALDGALALYPNPARGQATLSGAAPGQAVQVLDAMGRLVSTATADARGTATLRLPAGLAAGMYAVRVGAQVLRLTLE